MRSDISEILEEYIIDSFSISDISSMHPVRHVEIRQMHGLIFILILSGHGSTHTNNTNYEIKKGTLISIVPFQSYLFTSKSEDFSYENISFNLNFMADFPLLLKPHVAEKMEKSPCLSLNRETFKILKNYYSNIYFQYKRIEFPSRITILKASLYIFVSEVNYVYSQESIETKFSYNEQVTDNFLKLLHTFYREERKPAFYADKLHVTTKHLSKILQTTTGRSLYTWICEFVIKEARILLQTTNLNITQIADKLNFPNSSYFARYFRKYVGMSPNEFRC